MRLRKAIKSPDRFDEVVFRTKKDSTKPSYPELLASRTIQYKHTHKQAAFPSLPLIREHEADKAGEQTFCTSPLSTILIDGNSHQMSNESDYTILPRATGTGIISLGRKDTGNNDENENNHTAVAKRVANDICGHCHKKIRIQWDSLSLAVQFHIFNFFLRRQRCVEVVATSLKLTSGELHTISHQLNLRKIYQTPLETIRAYGIARGNLGPDIIDPEKIDDIIDYLVFASHYEIADESEIKRGRKFLKQLGFDDKMMDLFEDYKEGVCTYNYVQNQEPRSSLKRRRNSTSDNQTGSPSQADALRVNSRVRATARADITSLDYKVGEECSLVAPQNRYPALSSKRRSAPQENIKNRIEPESRGARLDIDNTGHASVARELNIAQATKHQLTQLSGIAINDELESHPSHLQQSLSVVGDNVAKKISFKPPKTSEMQRTILIDHTTQQHTSDIKTGNMETLTTQVDHGIQPEPVRHQLFGAEAAEIQIGIASVAHNDDKNPRLSAKVLLNTNVSQTNKAPSPFNKAPSYSPISDQDPESIPEWARYKKDAGDAQQNVPQLQNKPDTEYNLPLGRAIGGSIKHNHFLQGLLSAAAEDILIPSTDLSSQSTLTKSRRPDKAHQTSDSRNRDMHASPEMLQINSPAHRIGQTTNKKRRKDYGVKRGAYKKRSSGAVATASAATPAPLRTLSGDASAGSDTKSGDIVGNTSAVTSLKGDSD